MEKILEILKRIILASLGLYVFNIVFSPFGIFIPINVVTVGVLVILGLRGIIIIGLLFLFFFR